MLELMSTNSVKTTSLQLVVEVNFFRTQDGNKSEIRHDTLLAIIRDEFLEEISLQELLESNYTNERGKNYPMFELTIPQATSVLARESRFVRKAIIAKLEALQKPKELSRKELAQMVVDAEEENERLQLENQKLEVKVKVLAPKAEYTSKVLLSSSTMTTTQIAKDFGMSAIEINKRLCEMGIQFKQRGQYLLGSKYQNKGYMKSVSYIYPDEEGNDKTKLRSVWTEYGKAFLHSLFNKDLSFSKSYACPVPQLPAMI